jgi:hypothetical protein
MIGIKLMNEIVQLQHFMDTEEVTLLEVYLHISKDRDKALYRTETAIKQDMSWFL